MAGVQSATAEVPVMFIVQERVEITRDNDPNYLMDSHLAAALDEVGQVQPVVWSMSDPRWRTEVDAGKVPAELETYRPGSWNRAAPLVKADYVMVYTAVRGDGRLRIQADLYRFGNRRPVWSYGKPKGSRERPEVRVDGRIDTTQTESLMERLGGLGPDGEMMSVMVNGVPDWDSTADSVARTWVALLRESVFRRLPTRPRITPVEMTPDQRPTDPPVVLATPTPNPLVRIQTLIDEGKLDAALLAVMDAIDQDPFEPERRVVLAELLVRRGFHRQAAEAAERAIPLMRQPAPLFLVAARAYWRSGQPARARDMANMALAHGGDAATALIVLGDIAVIEGDFQRAIAQYSASLEQGPRPHAVVGRAVAFALAGNAEQCAADLARLLDADGSALRDIYSTAIELADRRTDQLAAVTQNLLIDLRRDGRNPASTARAAAVARSAEALSVLMERLPVPKIHEESHAARALAHKLLRQSGEEILDFAQRGDREAAAEAEMSLNEALRLLVTIRDNYRIERREAEIRPL